MNTTIKAIIDEMIDFLENPEKSQRRFTTAKKKIKKAILFALVRDILNWSNPFFIELLELNPDKMDINPEEVSIDYSYNMALLFSLCPDIKNIYEMNSKNVTFKKGLTKSEISEIREYVKENKKINIQSKETRMK